MCVMNKVVCIVCADFCTIVPTEKRQHDVALPPHDCYRGIQIISNPSNK